MAINPNEIFRLFGAIEVDEKGASKQLHNVDKLAEKTSISMGRSFDRIAITFDNVTKSIERTGKQMESFGRNLSRTAGIPLVGLTAAFGALSKATIAYGDDMAKQAQEVGMATEAYQELSFALGQNGVNADNARRALGRLNQRIGNARRGNQAYVDSLAMAGISMENLEQNALTTDEVFMQIIGNLSEMNDAQLQASVASDIFGTQVARKLLPAIRAGEQGFNELRQRAQQYGFVMDTEATRRSEQAGDAMDLLSRTIGGLTRAIGIQLLPPIINIAGAITDVVAGISEWVQENPVLVRRVIMATGAIATLLGVLVGAGTVFFITGKAIVALTTIMGLLFSKPFLIIVALSALYAAWQSDWLGMRTTLTTVWEDYLEPILSTLRRWLAEGFRFTVHIGREVHRWICNTSWADKWEDIQELFAKAWEWRFNIDGEGWNWLRNNRFLQTFTRQKEEVEREAGEGIEFEIKAVFPDIEWPEIEWPEIKMPDIIKPENWEEIKTMWADIEPPNWEIIIPEDVQTTLERLTQIFLETTPTGQATVTLKEIYLDWQEGEITGSEAIMRAIQSSLAIPLGLFGLAFLPVAGGLKLAIALGAIGFSFLPDFVVEDVKDIAGNVWDAIKDAMGLSVQHTSLDLENVPAEIKAGIEEWEDVIRDAVKDSVFTFEDIVAKIWTESHFRPDAVSPVGAKGIAQFMPDTWAEIASQMGFGEEDVWDPNKAIPGMVRYLEQQANRVHIAGFPEEERKKVAVAAYNMGYGYVQEATRIFAEEFGRAAESWDDLLQVMDRVVVRGRSPKLSEVVPHVERWTSRLLDPVEEFEWQGDFIQEQAGDIGETLGNALVDGVRTIVQVLTDVIDPIVQEIFDVGYMIGRDVAIPFVTGFGRGLVEGIGRVTGLTDMVEDTMGDVLQSILYPTLGDTRIERDMDQVARQLAMLAEQFGYVGEDEFRGFLDVAIDLHPELGSIADEIHNIAVEMGYLDTVGQKLMDWLRNLPGVGNLFMPDANGGGQGGGFSGFKSGGYTGNAPAHQAVGVVHGRETVIPEPAHRKGFPGMVQWLADYMGVPGFQEGGSPGIVARGMAGLTRFEGMLPASVQSMIDTARTTLTEWTDMIEESLWSLEELADFDLEALLSGKQADAEGFWASLKASLEETKVSAETFGAAIGQAVSPAVDFGKALLAGDWKQAFMQIFAESESFQRILQFLSSALEPVIEILDAILLPVIEGVIWAFQKVGNFFIDIINTVIRIVNMIPFVNIRQISRLGEGDSVEGDTGGGRTTGGARITEITGPTRDLLTDLLRPVANLGTLTGIGERIYNVLDARLPNFNDEFAAAGMGGITIQNLNVTAPAGGIDAVAKATIGELERAMAEQARRRIRGTTDRTLNTIGRTTR